MGIGVSIGTNILSSIIFEVGKNCLLSYGDIINRTSEINKLEERINDKFSTEYSGLYNSGEFVNFISNPTLKDIIEMYIMYKITGNYNPVIVKIKRTDHPVIEKDIIKFLWEKLSTEYYDVVTCPDRTLVECFFKNYFAFAKQYMLEQFNKEQKNELLFVNEHIDLAQEALLQRLDIIKQGIEDLKKYEFSKKGIKEYSKVVKEYHSILKTNHSSAHIYLLDSFEFSKFYVPPSLRHTAYSRNINDFSIIDIMQEKSEFDDWKYIFDYNNIVYITGGAGYGKSLFLKKIINDYHKMHILHSEEYIVIYGDLKSFIDEKGKVMPLLDYLQYCMMKETLLDENKISKELIETYLKAGRCIILLDALDEVEKDKRSELHSRLISNIKNQNPNNKICVTSRNRGFIPEKEIDLYEIQKLDQKHIEEYLDNIIKLKKFKQDLKAGFLERSKPLVDNEFLSSFLILSLLINIYRAELDLPSNKTELYDKCLDYIAIKREREKSKNVDWKLIIPMMKPNTFIELAQMCFPNNAEVEKNDIIEHMCNIYSRKYSCEAETECAVEELLKFCADRTELFVPATGEDKYKFFHRSFFEYYYAQYIFLRIKDNVERYNVLKCFDIDSEVQELTVSMLKQKDEMEYQELVDYIFVQAEGRKIKDKLIAINILNQIILIMDDIEYKNRYIQLLIKDKDFIIENIGKIFNQQNAKQLVLKTDEYAEKIDEVYHEYSFKILVSLFFNVVNMPIAGLWDEFDVVEESPFQILLEKSIKEYSNIFFIGAYKKKHDVKELLLELSIEELDNLEFGDFLKFKSTKNQLKKAAKEFFLMEEKKKNKIIELFERNI